MTKGFTLVETVVVTAIALLLSALLFPVLASAKENAKRSGVAQSMRQIGLASRLYSGDFDGQNPLALTDSSLELLKNGQGIYGALDERAQQITLPVLLKPYTTTLSVFRSQRDLGPAAGSWIANQLPTQWSSFAYDELSPLLGKTDADYDDPASVSHLMEVPFARRFPGYNKRPEPCLRLDQSLSSVLGGMCDYGMPAPEGR